MKRKERLSIQGLVNYSRSPHTAPWPRMLQFFPKLDLWPWLKVPQKPPLTKSHLMYVCRKKNTQSTNFNYYICKILKDFVYLYVCLSHLCVYVCTCTHMHACLYIWMWKSQANFGIHSSNVIHLVFIKRGVHWPGACWFSEVLWLVNVGEILVSVSPALRLQAHTTAPGFSWGAGDQTWVLVRAQQECYLDWAGSPAPKVFVSYAAISMAINIYSSKQKKLP